jgi:hypothetical protein
MIRVFALSALILTILKTYLSVVFQNSELKLLLHYIRLRGKMKRSFGLQTNMACSHIIRLVFGRYWFQIKPFRDFPQSIEEMQE